MNMKKVSGRTSWAIGRGLRESEAMPAIVLSCAILTFANTVAATPSRKGTPGVQVITVCMNVAEFEGFLKTTKDAPIRMYHDQLLMHQVLSRAVGLNYASQIVGGDGYVEGPDSESIGSAAATLYEVRPSYHINI